MNANPTTNTRFAPARPPGSTTSWNRLFATATVFCALTAITQAQSWETVDDIETSTPLAASAGTIATDSAGNVFVAGVIKDTAGVSHMIVMKSGDQGDTWTTSDDVAAATNSRWSRSIVSARIALSETVFVDHLVTASVSGGNKWLIRGSVDAGATWATLDLFIHPNSKYAMSEPPSLALDSAGNIYVSGEAVETIRKGNSTSTVSHPLIRKLEAGTWRTINLATPSGRLVAAGSDLFGITNTENSWQVKKSSDGGNTWLVVDTYRYDSGNVNSITSGFDIAADSVGNLYAVGCGQRAVTTGSGKNATTTFHRYWIVRKGSPGGGFWTTLDLFELGPRPNGLPAVNQAHGVTVDDNGDVYVTGVGIDAGGRTWVTRQQSAATGLWTTTDAFRPDTCDGIGIASGPSGNVFTIGLLNVKLNGTYHYWMVRRKLAQ
jgi:hypothetical protein